MANLTGAARERYVQAMFTQIAHRYDLMNRLMTAGQDVRWRKEVIRLAQLPTRGRLLDLGAGTGDLAREVLNRYPNSRVAAADFTMEMMRVRASPPRRWAGASADELDRCRRPVFALPIRNHSMQWYPDS